MPDPPEITEKNLTEAEVRKPQRQAGVGFPLDFQVRLHMEQKMICIPVSTATNAEMRSLMTHAENEPSDIIELRLDSLREPPDVEGLIAASTRPVIATCRSRRENGGFDGGDEERRRILFRAIDAGTAYVDAERLDIPYLAPKMRGKTLIASFHDYSGTPDNLSRQLEDMAKLPCDWIKFAVTHRRPADSVKVLDNIRTCPKPCIGVAMGEGGLMTRVLGRAYGSRVTYASIDRGYESGPGQPTAKDLVFVYRIRDISLDTPVYGLLGNPVAQSRGYRIHNHAFEQIGFKGVYIPFRAENGEEFLNTLPGTIKLRGLSVTIPHKPTALEWADTRSESAQRIGSANTLTWTNAGWRADNTDLPAIFESIKAVTDMEGVNLTGAPALVLGAGGTTRAAGFALTLLGCRVTVAARNREKAWRVASQMDWEVEELSRAVSGNWRVVANTTSVGMYPNIDETLFPAASWKRGMLAFEAVHNPRSTRFLRDAAEAGAYTVDGVEMFLRQAAEQFRMWTGVDMPRITSLT